MDRIKSRFTKPSNIDQANFLTRIFFGHVYSIFAKGFKNNGLEMDDLPGCSVDDEAPKLMLKLQKNWQMEIGKKNPSLVWALLRTFAGYYIIPWIMYLLEENVIFLAQPLMLGMVIRYFNGDPTIDYQWACVYALGVVLSMLITVMVDYPCIEHMMRVGMRQRTACCALMYNKSLRLSQRALKQTAIGQMVNIMSNDVSRLDDFSSLASYLVYAPLQTCIIVYIVWTYLGVSCLAGVVLLVLFIPFQAMMGKMFSKVRMDTAILTDTRLRYMNEIISGMRVIKMYCWEKPFAARVAESRKAEVSKVRKCCFLKAINTSIFFVVSRIILFACFVLYVLLGNRLTSEAVFVSMALFNTLRISMTLLFPQAVSAISEFLVSCKRIQKFLLLEERTIPLENNRNLNQQDVISLTVDKITAKWNEEQAKATLKNISLHLKPGDFLVVIGPVGSGKSSLLMSLLKELPLESGLIELQGSISYSSQDAWSFNDSVRNNILFGMEYDEMRYQKVIEICALQRDIKLMPFDDGTLVGEKGVSLSGGQKARINLARAVYRDVDIYLLDDPLSAVDAPVARHIFEKCIIDYLKSKICILVTHQMQFIERATKILLLKDGECLAFGTFEQIQQSGIDFVRLLEENKNEEKDKETNDDNRKRPLSEESSNQKECLFENEVNDDDDQIEDEIGEKAVQIEEEQYERGSIKGRIYWEYFRAGAGAILLSSMIVFTAISQTLFHGSDIFLTYWTNKNQNNTTITEKGQHKDVIIYSILIGALFLTTILRAITFFAICMRASVRLHNRIFARLLRTPVAFFDSNPLGRIMNRFAKDLGTIDEKMPYVAFDLNMNLIQTVGVVITVSLVNWYLVLPAIVLAIAIYYVRVIYIKSSLDIKRYEGIVRSPIYSHVSTTIGGLSNIRAFGAQAQLERQFHVYLNDYNACWSVYISTSRAFGFIMEWICIVYIIIITVSVMLSKDILGGDVGLVISSGLMLSGMTQWGVRQSAEFESQMTSVERIVEYQTLQQEASAESKKRMKPFEEWPKNGQIEFDHMSLAYGENALPILKNIHCSIKGGEKIGIVGRTGAGKSSMIAALFRLTEPSGAIRIDGIDIQSIGLDDLRKKISIIPQDPVVFSGTVRYNLDPFNEYLDGDLWAALEKVQLKTQVDNFDGKLEAQLSDSGANLSVGQRQLVCLARAILRRNRILILDEATANVDHQTDSLIQQTIRSEFTACTVLTIAHRLNTIIDCDRVLVLDAGEILEFDSPYLLLTNQSAFFEMCQKTGPLMYSNLHQLAKETYSHKWRPLQLDDDNIDLHL